MQATTTAPPAFGHDPNAAQRQLALQRANEVRSARATFKRWLDAAGSDGPRLAGELILDPPVVLDSMPLSALLTACRGIGAVRVHRLLRITNIPEQTSIGSLTSAQRHELLGAMRMIGVLGMLG